MKSNFVPKGVTRFAGRQLLKLNKQSPTILVVAGVVGLGATAVVAAKATRKIDPVLDIHKQERASIGYTGQKLSRNEQKQVTRLYLSTTKELGKIYAPAICLGTVSAVSILSGHKILQGRHVATLAAYTGLAEQFAQYRGRIAQSFGEETEQEIYRGGHIEMVEDPNHKGEFVKKVVYDPEQAKAYLQPWFDEVNWNYTRSPEANYMFLKGVQQHLNNRLQLKGHVFLNEAFDALGMDHSREGAVMGWLFEDRGQGDGYIDLGFMTGMDPQTIAFRNFDEPRVRLNFNVDNEPIWNLI